MDGYKLQPVRYCLTRLASDLLRTFRVVAGEFPRNYRRMHGVLFLMFLGSEEHLIAFQ
jgi:hypothetical protein